MRHRLFLLGLLVLTVVGVGAAAPSQSLAPAAAPVVLVGLLSLLWTYWALADRRVS